MQSFYKKGMNLSEIEEAAYKSCERLMEVSPYLNDAGKTALNCHNIIVNECAFVNSTEELIEELKKIISDSHTPSATRKILSTFVKNFLED